MKVQIRSLFILLCLPFSLLACMTPQKQERLNQELLVKTPFEVNVELPYIDAYANLKHYYDKCVQTKTITVINGVVSPYFDVKTHLDRENQIGTIKADIVDRPFSIVRVIPDGTDKAKVKISFSANIKSEKRMTQIKQRLTEYSTTKVTKCSPL